MHFIEASGRIVCKMLTKKNSMTIFSPITSINKWMVNSLSKCSTQKVAEIIYFFSTKAVQTCEITHTRIRTYTHFRIKIVVWIVIYLVSEWTNKHWYKEFNIRLVIGSLQWVIDVKRRDDFCAFEFFIFYFCRVFQW